MNPSSPTIAGYRTRTQSGTIVEKIWGKEFHSPDQNRKLDYRLTLPNPSSRWSDDRNDRSRIVLGVSTINTVDGLGGFAKTNLKEGGTVIYIGGTWCTTGAEAESIAPGFTIEVPEREAQKWAVKQRFLAMDPENNGRYLNDGLDEYDNNCRFEWNLSQGDPQKFCRVVTVREVMKMRELCIDYGVQHWKGIRLAAAGLCLRSKILSHHPNLDTRASKYTMVLSGGGSSHEDPIEVPEDSSPPSPEHPLPNEASTVRLDSFPDDIVIMMGGECDEDEAMDECDREGGFGRDPYGDYALRSNYGPEWCEWNGRWETHEHIVSGPQMPYMVELSRKGCLPEGDHVKTLLEKFTRKVEGEVKAAVAKSVTVPRFKTLVKTGARFAAYLTSVSLACLVVAEAPLQSEPAPNYELIASLPEDVQARILIYFGIYSQSKGKDVAAELSALKFLFHLECCSTGAFDAMSVKRSRSGFAKTPRLHGAPSAPPIFGITGSMMWSHIRAYERGFGEEVTPSRFLISLALLVMYDKGKRVGTVVHAKRNKSKKLKSGVDADLGRESVYHTIPARNITLITPEGPGQRRMNPLEYREYLLAPSASGDPVPDSEWIVAHFESDKDARRKFSIWKKGQSPLQDMLMRGMEKACVVCLHKSAEDNFFSFRNQRGGMTMIHRKQVADTVKALALEDGLPSENFSTRSCRKSFGTQQEQSNSVFAIPSAGTLNAAGGFEWSSSSVMRTQHYTHATCTGYSNLLTLGRGVEGTVTSRMDVLLLSSQSRVTPATVLASAASGTSAAAPNLGEEDGLDNHLEDEDNEDSGEDEEEPLQENFDIDMDGVEDRDWDSGLIFDLVSSGRLGTLTECITSAQQAVGMVTRSRALGGDERK